MIRSAMPEDCAIVTQLALRLWPKSPPDKLYIEFSEILRKEDAVVFICYDNALPVAFAHCEIRTDYVEGTSEGPVGYLEGIFVHKDYRRQKIGYKLLKECERWAVNKGCMEFASDCEADNLDSFNFHMQSGFSEANRVICFVKRL